MTAASRTSRTDIAVHGGRSTALRGGPAAPPTPAWLHLVMAVELTVFSVAVTLYVILRESFPQVQREALRFPYWGWGAAQIVLVALAAACAGMFVGRRRPSADAAIVLAGMAVVFGVAALGLKAMEWARWGGPRFLAVEAIAAAAEPAPAGVATAKKADPAVGAKAFAMTCAACHGPTAQGVAGAGPALANGELFSGSDDQLRSVIINGRRASDPASKTGKDMPARGGNPFLSDAEVAGIIAFLHELAGGTAAAPNVPSAAPLDIPRWVVPPPPLGPQAIASRQQVRVDRLAAVPAQLVAQRPTWAERTFAPVAAAFTFLQVLYLVVGIAGAATLMWRAYADPGSTAAARLGRFTAFRWLTALVLWAALFPLLYLL